MIAIPNMEKPKDCNSCRFLEGDAMDGLCHAMNLWLDDESLRWYAYEEDDIDDSKPLDCPLIEIDDTVWENEKHKLIRMTEEARINKAMAERRADGDI